ncbi:MAG TPA: PAS domain S-box protein [Polyangia bacterium]|nr:PAS domain S-box protein [Polyangia bacterium]
MPPRAALETTIGRCSLSVVTVALAFAILGALVVVYLLFLKRRTRRATEVSEAWHRDLIEMAPEAFFLADLDGRFTDVNQTACRMLGYSREELTAKTIQDVIPPEDVRRLARVRDGLRSPGKVHRDEWRLVRKDGTLVPVEVSSNILPGQRWQAFIRDISERKRIEDERRVFVSLLENSSDFIGIADPNGRPIYVNPAGRRLVGLPPEFGVGDTEMADYYPAEQRAFATDVIVKSTIERGRWSGETYLRHWRTGDPIPVSDEHFMIYEPGGKRLLGMGTVIRDITEARRAANELHESEERFRLMFDEAPIGMALTALDGRFVRVNAALCEIVGYTPGELEGTRFQDITHPDDLQSDLVVLRRLIRGDITRYHTEKRYVCKDGRIVPISLNVATLRDPAGQPQHFITQIEDVGERRRGEQERNRIEQDQRFLAEAGSVLVSSLDYEQTLTTLGQLMVRDFADWCIIDIVEGAHRSRRLKVVSGRAGQEQVCADIERLQLDRDLPHVAGPVFRTHRPYLIEQVTPREIASFAQSEEHLRLLRAMEPRSLVAVPMTIRGQLVGILILVSSSASRVYHRADLRLAEALADRAALAIENGRLYQTALNATQFRDEVLSVVAHDLRNPVTAIVMQASSLKRSGGEPERRSQKKVESILRSAERINRLIGDLLDVTLIEAGQMSVQQERLSARQLLLESVEAQRPLVASGSIDLEQRIEDDLPEIWGDQHRLMQVLQNLLSNAIKFTPPEGRIVVGAARRPGEVLFWVADTGCGISPEGLPRVFDRFWQAQKGAHRGAGLGLPITRGIVEAHGGHIWVESTLGRGSIFFFTIPEAPRLGAQEGQTLQ